MQSSFSELFEISEVWRSKFLISTSNIIQTIHQTVPSKPQKLSFLFHRILFPLLLLASYWYFGEVLSINLWVVSSDLGQSRWPRCLRRGSAAAYLLGLWVRIPPGAWIFVSCECCVLLGRGLCDELITRPEESYWLWCVVVGDLKALWMRRPCPTGGLLRQNIKKSSNLHNIAVLIISYKQYIKHNN